MNLKLTGLRVDVGEGSRGGHIIGRTRGGRPIYMSANHPAHQDFTAGEHRQAAKMHAQMSSERGKQRDTAHAQGDRSATSEHLNAVVAHDKETLAHTQAARAASAKGKNRVRETA